MTAANTINLKKKWTVVSCEFEVSKQMITPNSDLVSHIS